MERLSPTQAREAALVALIPRLTRAARQITRSAGEAEDLVQEALLQVWARQRAGAKIDALPAYAMTTLRNQCRHHTARQVELPLDIEPPGPPAEGPRRIALSRVLSEIADLPDDQRRLIVRVLTEDLTYAELARSEGLPEGTVTSRLGRARARLRRRVGLETRAPVASLFDGDVD